MGIKPTLGWLALLFFTTAAQAEGTRDVSKLAPKGMLPVAARVTAKTKGAVPLTTTASSTTSALVVVESVARPRADYEAEAHSDVPLDGATAKERGLDKGLVTMVFERQRRASFRVGHEKIRRAVRLAAEDRAVIATARPRLPAKESIDVLDTEDGVIVVATYSGEAWRTSDVYTFAKHATLDQRIGALESVAAPARERVREALVIAEWSR